ncbi:hypothetical protein IJ556_00215 [bacterium]|nr:hypothetical protein [bacterium]
MAEVAPPIKDGADRLLMHAEWDNQDNLPENGFTEYYRYLYLTREMNKSPNIIERSIVVRNMFDAGFLRPNGMPDNEWEEKKTMVGKYPKDKEALVSSLCRLEGVNKVFQKIVRNHKLENMKQRSSAAKSLRIGKPKKMNVGKEMSDMENVR